MIDTLEFPEENTLLASYRHDSGWQILVEKEEALFLLQFPSKQQKRTYLEKPEMGAKTAAWSPCGQFIAVGNSKKAQLSVWHTDTGKLRWKCQLVLNIKGELIDPVTLSITGWSNDGSNIITCLEYILIPSIIIWEAESGKRKLMID
ncbi:MAG: WD40 repeat domain-containing protein [gamma proteobacterium symbiont of Bathyaustriella thionipta]|nr:WD40 repeat domain-containing protein [gamma proteobacterium symbiont of Bathyaustriella thionipta]